MTAYAYLRKSVVHDPSRELSHDVQEAAVLEMAARNGDNHGSLVMLSDWDKSGRLGADKRPGYKALLEAIESGKATAIYSYSLSRLARSVAELARLIADCDKRGIPVRLYADHVDTATASGKLLTHVLGAVAQFEADVASERIRAANAAKLAKGGTLRTVRLYGEGEGDDAGAVLEAFREAGSFSGAAKLLNERGVKPRSSARGVWWPSSVAVVVKRLEPTVATHKASRGYAAGGTDFILARLLRCPTCGTRLTGTRDREGKRVRYACRLGTAIPHPRVTISEHMILPAIQAEADRFRPRLVGDAAEEGEDGGNRRAALMVRRERVLDMYVDGVLDKAERDRRLTAIQDEIERADSARMLTVAIPDRIPWGAPARELNGLLRELWDGIELDPETFAPVRYEWRLPAEYWT